MNLAQLRQYTWYIFTMNQAQFKQYVLYIKLWKHSLDSTPDIFYNESSTVQTVYFIYFKMNQAQFR